MQRPSQPPRATATTLAMRHVASSTLHASLSAPRTVGMPPAVVKGTSVPISAALAQPRRALQPLDHNRTQTMPSSVAKAPFAYVSRFSRPLPSALSTTTATTSLLTGLKRKQEQLEEAVSSQQQQLPEPSAETDPLDQQQRENIAWIDMLVALLERKYAAYAPPVNVDDLERAHMLDAYWSTPKKPIAEPPLPVSASKRARVSPPSGSGSSNAITTSSQDEKEEKRLQALRRHAQQIQDTSVSSTSCCGCKTGCLKMYCVCFSTRGYCHDGCTCENCKNARASADQRLDAITSYLTNDPRAFSYAAPTGSANGFFQLLPEKSSTVVLRGCRCKKSKCLKKYCECFQNGLGCGPHCRCVDCSNDGSAAAREMRAKNASDASINTSQPLPAASPTATTTGGTTSGAFHAIKVAVTKKPRRNYVVKSVRLRL